MHYRYENSGKYESVGGTLSLDYRLTSFSGLKFSISEIGRKDDFYEKDEFLFSTNVTAGAEFDFLKNTANVSLLYNYYGKYPRYGYDTEGEIVILSAGDYHNMDINISKSFLTNKLILRGGVKNLFDNTEIQGGEGSNGGAHSGGYTSLVGWGRTLFVGVVFNFSKYAK